MDWAAAEALAYATLAMEGYRVRLTGQDSIRGTFSHRHAAYYDTEDGHSYFPLKNLGTEQMPVEIINSPLSEAGVLGFEYGYSLGYPDALVLWEAQFGDFANVAQVIIDQFILSAEEKWRHLSGIVLLLPHGFEGQGPEHSSPGRAVLRLGNDENVQVVVPSTPAQFFHVLRRQALRRWKKPLVVLTPKSLLRHPACVSSLEDLSRGRFQRVIPDATMAGKRPRRVLLCSGKVYYELLGRPQPAPPGRGDRSLGAVAPPAALAVEGGLGTVCRRHARRLGPGGAAEHVCLVQPEDQVRRPAVRAFSVLRGCPQRVGHAGHRFGLLLSHGAKGASCPGVRRTLRAANQMTRSAGREISRGLSQFSFHENGTVPIPFGTRFAHAT